MALRALNPKVLHPFIPKSQVGTERPATFHCRAIPASEIAKLDDVSMSADFTESGTPTTAMAQMSVGTRKYRYLVVGLRRWDNIDLEDGSPAPFSVNTIGEPTDETLTMIPGDIRDEIAEFIESLNTITEHDKKA